MATRYVARELKELELHEMESFRERMSPRDDMRVIESEREGLGSGVKQSNQQRRDLCLKRVGDETWNCYTDGFRMKG